MAAYSKTTSNTAPRIIALVLLVLLVLIQYPLWSGKGSERGLQELRIQLVKQKQANENVLAQINQLQVEAASLREGKDALEARARLHMNMIRENEVLFRLSEYPEDKK